MTKPRYIDTHCHLYESDFENDSEEVIKKIETTGVEYVLLVNTDTDTITPLINFEKRYPTICRSMIGVHPINVWDDYKSQIKIIEKSLDEHHFIGIGEIGLDYHESLKDHDLQKKFLEAQLDVALDHKLPASIHIRDAFDDALTILAKKQNGNLSGVIHCFSGDIDQAKRCINLGFALGIGGIVTFKKSKLPEVLKQVPIEKIVLETDSPCLAPTPYRGKRNDSSFLSIIVDKIAEIYELPHEIVANTTTTNAKNIFNLQ